MLPKLKVRLNTRNCVLALEFARVCEHIVKTGGPQPPRFENARRALVDVLAGNAISFEQGAAILEAVSGYVWACRDAVEKHGENPEIIANANVLLLLAEDIRSQMQALWGAMKPGTA